MGALGGCSSSGDGGGGGGGKGAGGDGRLDYTGAATGAIDARDVGCFVVDGKLEWVATPGDRSGSTASSFFGSLSGKGPTNLVAKDRTTYMKAGAQPGLSAGKKGGTWTVTVSGVVLDDLVSGGSVTVNGHLTCTKTAKG